MCEKDTSLRENFAVVALLLQSIMLCIGSLLMIVFASSTIAQWLAIVSGLFGIFNCVKSDYIQTQPYKIDLILFTSVILLSSMIFDALESHNYVWILILPIFICNRYCLYPLE